MSHEVSRSEFASRAGVSRAALSKAEATARVVVTPEGMVRVADPVNKLFLEIVRGKKITQMILTGHVLPGWGCLAVEAEGQRLPLYFYPPGGRDILPTEYADDYTVDLREAATAMGPDRRKYPVTFIVHPKVRPPWLSLPGFHCSGLNSPSQYS